MIDHNHSDSRFYSLEVSRAWLEEKTRVKGRVVLSVVYRLSLSILAQSSLQLDVCSTIQSFYPV